MCGEVAVAVAETDYWDFEQQISKKIKYFLKKKKKRKDT